MSIGHVVLGLTLQREPIATWFELFQKRFHRFRNSELRSIVGVLLDLRCSTKNGKRRQKACDEESGRPRSMRSS